jgi:2-polyprenyl-3-methyl-5-hydroxy-6-metoxy-1,4-benzoquinol methylase
MKKEINAIINSILNQVNQLKIKIDTLVPDQPVAPVAQVASIAQITQPNNMSQQDRMSILKKFVYENPNWSAAVPPDLICDENSHEDKMDRANGIRDVFHPNFVFDNKKVLDFGTGYGHLIQSILEKNPAFVIGYDILGDFQVGNTDKSLLTTSWDEVTKNGPYDLIYLYDVIDHVEHEQPHEILLKAKSVLKDDGVIRMRAHPFISKHGGHTYTKVNKGYAHLILTKEELSLLGHNFKNYPTIFVTTPVKTYNEFINKAGLRNADQKTITEPADSWYLTGDAANRIRSNLRINNLLIPQMGMHFLDFTLTK